MLTATIKFPIVDKLCLFLTLLFARNNYICTILFGNKKSFNIGGSKIKLRRIRHANLRVFSIRNL